MGIRKHYEPRCPAADCSGGYASRLYRVTAEAVQLPAEILVHSELNNSIGGPSETISMWPDSSSKLLILREPEPVIGGETVSEHPLLPSVM